MPSSVHYYRYKRLRNLATKQLRKAKTFFNNISSHTNNSKKFWSSFKSINKSDSSYPMLKHKDRVADSNMDKSEIFNNFFSMCFNNQVPPLVPEDSDSIPSDPNGCNQDLLCTVKEVADILAKLDPSKATGPDKISTHMLKATAHSIAPSITKLFNLSIKLGKLPHSRKTSNVIPIPKGGDPSLVSNYHPISLLSIVSKCLETHIF